YLPFIPSLVRAAPWLTGALAIALVALSARAPAVHFDADFAALDRADLPSFRLEREVNDLLGRSQTPLVVLARDDAQAEAVAGSLRSRMASLGNKATVGQVAPLGELVSQRQL